MNSGSLPSSDPGYLRQERFWVVLTFAWLVPLALLWWYPTLYTLVPGVEPLALILLVPVVAFGTLAPCLFAAIGAATGNRRSAHACLACGVSMSVLAALFTLIGSFTSFLVALEPILPSVLLNTAVAGYAARGVAGSIGERS